MSRTSNLKKQLLFLRFSVATLAFFIAGITYLFIDKVEEQDEEISKLTRLINSKQEEINQLKSDYSKIDDNLFDLLVWKPMQELQNKRFVEYLDKNRDRIFELGLKINRYHNTYINFSDSTIQLINSGFAVTSLELSEHLTGIKFKGRIINTTSVRHRNVEFKIKVNV